MPQGHPPTRCAPPSVGRAVCVCDRKPGDGQGTPGASSCFRCFSLEALRVSGESSVDTVGARSVPPLKGLLRITRIPFRVPRSKKTWVLSVPVSYKGSVHDTIALSSRALNQEAHVPAPARALK